MAEISGIAILTAFAAGLISFLSPCVLPLVPGYVSFVAGRSLDEIREEPGWRAPIAALTLSLLFVTGFSVVFIALGASASAIGRQILAYRYEANIVAGAIVILFGLFMAGLVKIPWFQRDVRYHGRLKGGRPIAAFSLGLAFAFGLTPCIGPVLGAILTVSAISTNEFNGVALLGIYSMGLGVPFLLAAVFTGAVLPRMKALRRVGQPLQIAAGAVLIVMGIAMITGYLSTFSYWLLRTFPGLGTIG